MKTTKEQPYIEFRFSEDGKLTYKLTSHYWGGINSGFTSTDGSRGNSCKPEDLNKYIERFKRNEIKRIEREIEALQKKKESMIKMFKL